MENNRRSFLKKSAIAGIGLGTYPSLSGAAEVGSTGARAAYDLSSSPLPAPFQLTRHQSRIFSLRIMGVLVISLLISSLTVKAEQNRSVANIQRTMSKLEASTTENPAQVRVMFYGQSITAQAWTDSIERLLRERYPTVKFEFLNAAIGGFQSDRLIRTADHDLYPWYPDLLFFHVYGPMDKYEEIIRRVRERTTAEIVIWTSHLNKDDATEFKKGKDVVNDERSNGIRNVARKYNCMMIDLRAKWCEHVTENKIDATSLLRDNVHLNNDGVALYAKFIGEEIMRVPGLGDNATRSGTIETIAIDSPAVTKNTDGSLTLKFSGNRVVAVSDGTGVPQSRARILLDGKPVDQQKELWAITRPGKGPEIWQPAIMNIGFEQPLLEEEWTLTCLSDSNRDGKNIHFKLQGSITGDDGEGWSTERFISNSKRATIDPSDWRMDWILAYRKIELPEGFEVTWRSYPLFTSIYTPQPAETRTVLMQGCANMEHTLTIIPEGGAPGISSFIVYKPGFV